MNRNTHMAADGMAELIAFLSGDADELDLVREPTSGAARYRLRLRREPTAPMEATVDDHPAVHTRYVQQLTPQPPKPLDPPSPSATADFVLTADGDPAPGDPLVKHIRVAVDLSRVPVDARPSDPAVSTLLRLHQNMFQTAQRHAESLMDGGSFVITIAGGIDTDGRLHPFTGLFTGFMRALILEAPGLRAFALVDSEADQVAIDRAVDREWNAHRDLPIVYYVHGQRMIQRITTAQARPEPSPLNSDSVVVSAGGARGIGAEVLKQLARDHAPRIHILGSSPLDVDEPALLDVDDNTFEAGRKDFIRTRTGGPDRLTPAAANAAYERIARARAIRATLNELERHCGEERVTYHHCDVRDLDAVTTALEGIDRIDLVLHVAGVMRPGSVAKLPLDDYLAVRDTKVLGYLNLKAALADRPPKLWCNFGSLAAFLGQPGETAYCSANEFLNTAAANAPSSTHEVTVCSGLWGEAGRAATGLERARVVESGGLTPVGTAEGVRHFLAELGQANGTATPIFMGDVERSRIERQAPGYLAWCETEPVVSAPTSTRPGFYIDEIISSSETDLVATRVFDPDRDHYLRQHLIDDRLTLPGTFITEIAAEAALRLTVHRVPVTFENLSLHTYLRVNGPQPKRILARLRTQDDNESIVDVKVVGDVVAKTGQILLHDRPYASVTIRLRDNPIPPPNWRPWEDTPDAEDLTVPYQVPTPVAHLTGVFASMTRPRAHARGSRARFALDTAAAAGWLEEFTVPVVLMDALAELFALNGSNDGWIPLALPTKIQRIDLFGTVTDTGFAGVPVGLFATPRPTDITADPGQGEAIAILPNGTAAVRLSGMTGTIRGYVHQHSGDFRVDLTDRQVVA